MLKTWECLRCGHVVISEDRPSSIRWSDGHTCHFSLANDGLPLLPIEEAHAFERLRQKGERVEDIARKQGRYYNKSKRRIKK